MELKTKVAKLEQELGDERTGFETHIKELEEKLHEKEADLVSI